MSEIETFGEALPRLIMESVVDPEHPGQFRLHTWNGRRAATACNVTHNGLSYIPKTPAGGLVQLVRFAPPSQSFGSATQLISSLQNLLSTYVRLRPEVRDLLVAFVLCTWFWDCMPIVPILHLFGPDSVVSQVLRLLGCLCHRPILLADVDFEGLATLPSGLGATLLINQKLGRRVKRALLASRRRHFCVVHGRRRLDLCGARAFSCDGSPGDEPGLRMSLSPTQDPLPFLTDSQEQVIAQGFQARLLRYRMTDYERVRDRKIDCRPFVPEMRDEARAWLAPIVDCRQLSKSVFEEILRQSREAADVRFFDPRCIVAEAALAFCHKTGVTQFYVGELAETANALLKGRHEEFNLSSKRVGSVLRELGVLSSRVAEGYRVVLTDAVRAHIHELATDYQVLSIEDGMLRCTFCRERPTASQRSQ